MLPPVPPLRNTNTSRIVTACHLLVWLNCSCQEMEDKNYPLPMHVSGVPSRKLGGKSKISLYRFSFSNFLFFILVPKFLYQDPVPF